MIMQNEEKNATWGGRREGSGRKKKDDEPKVTITFTIPQGAKERVREIVRAEVERYRKERDGGQ